jgi:hypothetical protein
MGKINEVLNKVKEIYRVENKNPNIFSNQMIKRIMGNVKK